MNDDEPCMNMHEIAGRTPSQETCACGRTDSSPQLTYVYAIGRIQFRFPTVDIEKELAQVISHSDSTGLTDQQAVHQVLSKPENRYIARRLCWVMSIEGLDTYLILPRDTADLGLLIESVRMGPRPTDLDVVIGMRGPIAPPDMCNGLQIPIVLADQIYSFDANELIKAIPRPDTIPPDYFAAAAEECFYRIMQLADNAGATDEHRALNYLAVRYAETYATVARAHGRGEALSGVDVRPSRLSGTRRVVDVIFSLTNRQTDVTDKRFVRVDVTEEFPFLISKMQPYYDR
ncbi:MAG: hypothetical protein U0X20_22000 [Caldilineaceae bacterium]